MANCSASKHLRILNIYHVSVAYYIGLKSLNEGRWLLKHACSRKASYVCSWLDLVLLQQKGSLHSFSSSVFPFTKYFQSQVKILFYEIIPRILSSKHFRNQQGNSFPCSPSTTPKLSFKQTFSGGSSEWSMYDSILMHSTLNLRQIWKLSAENFNLS